MHGTLRFLFLSHLLYGIRPRMLLTDNIQRGAAVVSTITSCILLILYSKRELFILSVSDGAFIRGQRLFQNHTSK